MVISSHPKRDILHSLHHDRTAGHFGFCKTYEEVRRRRFRPRLYATVFQYVTSCESRQGRKAPMSLPEGLLQPLSPTLQSLERVGIGFLGPLALPDSNNRWVVVTIDHLTRYAVTAALPAETSSEIAEFFIWTSCSTVALPASC